VFTLDLPLMPASTQMRNRSLDQGSVSVISLSSITRTPLLAVTGGILAEK
jgi:hypothetical protein